MMNKISISRFLPGILCQESSVTPCSPPKVQTFFLCYVRGWQKGYPLSLSEEGSGRDITLLTSPMSCTLSFVAFLVCVCVYVLFVLGFFVSKLNSLPFEKLRCFFIGDP